MQRKRYSRLQEYYDLGRLYNHLFVADRAAAALAHQAKLVLWRKMSPVEREIANKQMTVVTHGSSIEDLKRLITGRA